MLITRNLWPNIPYENKTLEERINLLWKRKHFRCFEKAYARAPSLDLELSSRARSNPRIGIGNGEADAKDLGLH